MRYTLKLEPPRNSYIEILNCFNKGKPLSPAQINFLRNYHSKVSDNLFDKVINYYGVLKEKSLHLGQYNLTRHKLNILKNILNSEKYADYKFSVEMTPTQLFQFQTLLGNELDFFPVYNTLYPAHAPGGVEHVNYLIWGKRWGRVSYEKANGYLSPKIHIHFERKVDKNLELFKANNNSLPQSLAHTLSSPTLSHVQNELTLSPPSFLGK